MVGFLLVGQPENGPRCREKQLNLGVSHILLGGPRTPKTFWRLGERATRTGLRDKVGQHGATALFIAALRNHAPMAELLIERRAQLDRAEPTQWNSRQTLEHVLSWVFLSNQLFFSFGFLRMTLASFFFRMVSEGIGPFCETHVRGPERSF